MAAYLIDIPLTDRSSRERQQIETLLDLSQGCTVHILLYQRSNQVSSYFFNKSANYLFIFWFPFYKQISPSMLPV